MIRTIPAVSALAIAVALVVAGCGGSSGSGESGAYGSSGESTGSTQAASGGSSGGRYGGSSSTSTAASSSGAVSVASVGDLGKVLVDPEGFTLYYFEKDKGGESACYGACASAWPPLTTSGAPHAMSAAEPSKLGTTKRKDGTTQVVYAGWPLYTYTADAKPGEDNGTDVKAFGGAWYPLHPDGEKAGD